MKYIYCRDGERPSYLLPHTNIENDIHLNSKFNLVDYNALQDGEIHFVGHIINGNEELFSIPKHYPFNKKDFNATDRKIIIRSIILTRQNDRFTATEKGQLFCHRYHGFPFNSFNGIYKYYLKFGLYHHNRLNYLENSKGNISWKKSIEKSNIFYNGKSNNFVLLPLYVKNKSYIYDFISSAMNSAIIYTLIRYGKLLHISYDESLPYRESFFYNRELTVRKLIRFSTISFNSYIKRLLFYLINFYKNIDISARISGTTDFAMVWENAVQKYLTDYFNADSTVKSDGYPMFNGNQHKNHFKHEPNFRPVIGTFYDEKNDFKGAKSHLEPDHYMLRKDLDTQFIFDSKYYKILDNLNIKQIIYQLYLMHRASHTINALMLPTSSNIMVQPHFNSLPINDCTFTIWAVYLNMKKVLQNYI